MIETKGCEAKGRENFIFGICQSDHLTSWNVIAHEHIREARLIDLHNVSL